MGTEHNVHGLCHCKHFTGYLGVGGGGECFQEAKNVAWAFSPFLGTPNSLYYLTVFLAIFKLQPTVRNTFTS